MTEYAKRPKDPPSGADFSALVKKVNEVAVKVGVAKLPDTVTARIPLWKRYVGGEGPEYDAVDEGGLRTTIKANAVALDAVKKDVDVHSQQILDLRADVEALKEAPPSHPFP